MCIINKVITALALADGRYLALVPQSGHAPAVGGYKPVGWINMCVLLTK